MSQFDPSLESADEPSTGRSTPGAGGIAAIAITLVLMAVVTIGSILICAVLVVYLRSVGASIRNGPPPGWSGPPQVIDTSAAPGPGLARQAPTGATLSAVVGGTGGEPFVLADPASRPIVGFRYRMGEWGGQSVIAELTPVLEGEAVSPTALSVVAPPGHVVGGVMVDGVQFVNAVQVLFVPVEEEGADPAGDSASQWIGFPTGRPTTEIARSGDEVTIGVHGRKGLVLDAIGLVLAPRPAPTAEASVESPIAE